MAKNVKLLSKRELKSFLKKHSDWKVNKRETEISRVFDFTDYIQGLIFIARVSVHAEVHKHHPDMTLSYGKVAVKLKTHDVKGLTKLDTALAGKIDTLYK